MRGRNGFVCGILCWNSVEDKMVVCGCVSEKKICGEVG